MTDPIDWELARRVASRAARRQPFAETYWSPQLVADFSTFTAQAEELVAATTGLRSQSGAARARVTDRDGWIDANLRTFQRMMRPLLDKMAPKMSSGAMVGVGRKVAGAELGVLLGWMSCRVLGQYDLLIVEDDEPDEQDIVYYVGPNLVALERRFAFPPEQFRLWLALHEVTHRAQFTGVPWMRTHFLGLVQQAFDSVDPDPERFVSAFRRLVDARRNGDDALADGGLSALLATPEQKLVLDQIAGLMSLLEGHGDVTMDRAGAALIPGAHRFGHVLRQRRQASKGLVKLMQRLIGLDAKIRQYEQGEAFIAAVERVGGTELLDRVWEEPAHLPTIAEIRDPSLWIDRIQLPVAS